MRLHCFTLIRRAVLLGLLLCPSAAYAQHWHYGYVVDYLNNTVSGYVSLRDSTGTPLVCFGSNANIITERVIHYRGGYNPIEEFTHDEAVRRLKKAALQVGKPCVDPVPHSLGHTTSVFNPDPDPESNTFDGYARRSGLDQNWATTHDSAGFLSSDSDSSFAAPMIRTNSTPNWTEISRAIFGFDTASIPDGDTISSATLTITGTTSNGGSADDFGEDVGVDVPSPASATSVSNADYNVGNWDGVEQSSARIAISAWDDAGTNVFTLNATGIANISKTGVSWFGLRIGADLDDTEPSITATDQSSLDIVFADQTGTDDDPTLTVEHSSAGGSIAPTWYTTLGAQ